VSDLRVYIVFETKAYAIELTVKATTFDLQQQWRQMCQCDSILVYKNSVLSAYPALGLLELGMQNNELLQAISVGHKACSITTVTQQQISTTTRVKRNKKKKTMVVHVDRKQHDARASRSNIHTLRNVVYHPSRFSEELWMYS